MASIVTMQCEHCDNEMALGSKFCNQCGARVSVDDVIVTNELVPDEEELMRQIEQNVNQLGESVEVKVCARKAFEAIQRATQSMAHVKKKESGLIGWLTSGPFGQTGKVMGGLTSELGSLLYNLHSNSLGSDNPNFVAQGNALANLIQVAIDSANIVGGYYDAPNAGQSVQQAKGQIDSVSRGLAAFLK